MSKEIYITKTFGSLKSEYGDMDANNNYVTNLAEPINAQDATNKQYVDHLTKMIGNIKYSVKNTDHDGWLVCNGRTLNVAAYPDLFALIGTSFGTAGAGTFKLPDCRGRVLGGIGQGSGLTNRSLGNSVGEEVHTQTVSEMPSHTHTSNAVGGTLGLISSDGANTASGGLDSTANEPNLYTTPVALTIDPTGDGQAFNVMQPTLFIGNVFIYSIVI